MPRRPDDFVKTSGQPEMVALRQRDKLDASQPAPGGP
jgi:hypothetical protein